MTQQLETPDDFRVAIEEVDQFIAKAEQAEEGDSIMVPVPTMLHFLRAQRGALVTLSGLRSK